MATTTETGQRIAGEIERLCRAREITIAQFERDLKLSHGYVRKLKIGQVPSVDRLSKMADYLGVANEFLLGEVSSLSNEKKGSGVKIPLLGKVAAGLPIEAAENVIGEEEIPARLAESATYFALLIKGDSMSPYICNGDKVIVRQQSEVENGEIAIVLVNGSDAVCKEFKRLENGIMLISKNPNYDPMIFTHDEIDTKPVRVIGRVVEIRREV